MVRAGAVEEQSQAGATPNHSQARQVQGDKHTASSLTSHSAGPPPPTLANPTERQGACDRVHGALEPRSAQEEWRVGLGEKGNE